LQTTVFLTNTVLLKWCSSRLVIWERWGWNVQLFCFDVKIGGCFQLVFFNLFLDQNFVSFTCVGASFFQFFFMTSRFICLTNKWPGALMIGSQNSDYDQKSMPKIEIRLKIVIKIPKIIRFGKQTWTKHGHGITPRVSDTHLWLVETFKFQLETRWYHSAWK